MVFNYTTATDITSLTGLGTYLNSVTSDVFGLALLMSVFVIFFISLTKKHTTKTCFGVASWVTLIVSFFTFAMGWTNIIYTILFMIAVGASLFMMYGDDKE